MAIKLVGSTSGNIAEVDSSNNTLVNLPGNKSDGTARGGGNANSSAILSENDTGLKTGARWMLSPETDSDSKLRINSEMWLDNEDFNYTAQNTGKHQLQNTTQTITFSAAGLLTNASGITTTTTGCSYRTYASFPMIGNGQIVYAQFQAAISAQPTANCTVDFGLFLQPTSNPYAPTDGVYFRQDSTGFKGVITNNGTETSTALTGFTYSNNQVYRFVISCSAIETCFWINEQLYARVATPVGQAAPFLSTALPMGIRQTHVGAAGAVLQFTFKHYSISTGGIGFSENFGQRGNAVYGSYQGLSGGTMGTLGTYTNSTNPTAAVPTNTTAAVGAVGLLNQAWETFSLALNTDGILLSYQVPAGTVAVQGKRLKVTGVKLSAYIQAALTGGPIVRTFALAYGHTAVSMATAEAATTKARRIVLLPELTQIITAAQAVSTSVSQPGGCVSLFPEPVYVNPGEFVAVIVKGVGTVGTVGTIVNHIQLIYSWE